MNVYTVYLHDDKGSVVINADDWVITTSGHLLLMRDKKKVACFSAGSWSHVLLAVSGA